EERHVSLERIARALGRGIRSPAARCVDEVTLEPVGNQIDVGPRQMRGEPRPALDPQERLSDASGLEFSRPTVRKLECLRELDMRKPHAWMIWRCTRDAPP